MNTIEMAEYAGKANMRQVVMTDKYKTLNLIFSYGVCIAFQLTGWNMIITAGNWSNTTSRHISLVDGGSADSKKRRLERSQFEEMLSNALRDVFSTR